MIASHADTLMGVDISGEENNEYVVRGEGGAGRSTTTKWKSCLRFRSFNIV